MLYPIIPASGRSEGDSTSPGAHSSSSSLHGPPSSIEDFPNADVFMRDIELSAHSFGNTHFFHCILFYYFFVLRITVFFCFLLNCLYTCVHLCLMFGFQSVGLLLNLIFS